MSGIPKAFIKFDIEDCSSFCAQEDEFSVDTESRLFKQQNSNFFVEVSRLGQYIFPELDVWVNQSLLLASLFLEGRNLEDRKNEEVLEDPLATIDSLGNLLMKHLPSQSSFASSEEISTLFTQLAKLGIALKNKQNLPKPFTQVLVDLGVRDSMKTERWSKEHIKYQKILNLKRLRRDRFLLQEKIIRSGATVVQFMYEELAIKLPNFLEGSRFIMEINSFLDDQEEESWYDPPHWLVTVEEEEEQASVAMEYLMRLSSQYRKLQKEIDEAQSNIKSLNKE
jgi:hypothetical protein